MYDIVDLVGRLRKVVEKGSRAGGRGTVARNLAEVDTTQSTQEGGGIELKIESEMQ